jgi:bacterioferritin-associated ferredoxin
MAVPHLDIKIDFANCDHVRVWQESGSVQWELKACSGLTKLIHSMVAQYGRDPSLWSIESLPQASVDHVIMIIRRLILEAQGKWVEPYLHEELCHCRRIAYKDVVAAIYSGAQSCDQVAHRTQAGSACGACRVDTLRIINVMKGDVKS